MTPDDDLVRRVLKGDEAAFTELMRRHEERLFNIVYRIVGNVEDAQDVVQNTFITAFQTLASYRGNTPAQFFTWLYRIAYNVAISHKRVQSNEKGFAVVRPERDERMEQAYAALQRLPPSLAFVLFLKDMADCKYPAIAELLQLPLGTVRSRLQRARLELKLHLETPDSDSPLIVAPRTDGSLAAAAGSGDMDAFCSLIMRYVRHLHAMVGELTRDPAPLLGAVVLAVRQRLEEFKGEKPFVTWLHQLVIDVAKRK